MQNPNSINNWLQDASDLRQGPEALVIIILRPTATTVPQALSILLVALQSTLDRADFLISTVASRPLKTPSKAGAQYFQGAYP